MYSLHYVSDSMLDKLFSISARVPSLRTSNKPLIGIGKHLCGSATGMCTQNIEGLISKHLCGSAGKQAQNIEVNLCCTATGMKRLVLALWTQRPSDLNL